MRCACLNFISSGPEGVKCVKKKGKRLNNPPDTFSALLALLSLTAALLLAPRELMAAADTGAEQEQQWVLQLGYFANMQNALRLKQELAAAGFDAQTVSTGLPGKQRYRVISGRADAPGELEELRLRIAEQLGHEGYALHDPFDTEKVREVFDEPQAKYLLAQAATDLPLDPSPKATIGYDSGLAHIPAELFHKSPGTFDKFFWSA